MTVIGWIQIRSTTPSSPEQRDELASSYVGHGLPPEPAVPAYCKVRMPRKRPQVLGIDLNRSESSRGGPIFSPFAPPAFLQLTGSFGSPRSSGAGCRTERLIAIENVRSMT